MEKPKYLIINPEDFKKNYDLNIVPYIKQDYQGNDYISWSIALKLLRDYNPNLVPELIKTETLYNEEGASGVLLHIVIRDLSTDLITPSLQYPVMGKKNNESLAYPEARDMSDNLMRGYVKAIAIYTGIGYRLFTREGIDTINAGKTQTRSHFKFKALTRIEELLNKLEAEGIDYDVKEPNFGLTSFELKELGISLSSLTKTDSNAEDYPPHGWTQLKDALQFASDTLKISLQEAEVIYQETPVNDQGMKRDNYYRRILELSK